MPPPTDPFSRRRQPPITIAERAGAALPALVLAAAAVPLVLMGLSVYGLACNTALENPSIQRLALLLLVAPILEEIVFRAGLQDLLAWLLRERAGYRLIEITVAAALFAVAHLYVTQHWSVLLYLVPGAALAWLYQRRRNLVLNMVLHAWFNAVALLACALR